LAIWFHRVEPTFADSAYRTFIHPGWQFSNIDTKGSILMDIQLTAQCRWRRRLTLAASAVLVAAGLLLPVGGTAVAQPGACPTSPIGPRAPSQVSAADRATILKLHNQYRNEVGVPPLAWDDSLADAAQGWADITAALGKLCHDPNRPNQGENLAYHQSVTDGVMLWYEEKRLYDSNPGPVLETGNPWLHYSQMVWSSTQRVGCGQNAFAQHPGSILLDCRYSPPGNVRGQFPYPSSVGRSFSVEIDGVNIKQILEVSGLPGQRAGGEVTLTRRLTDNNDFQAWMAASRRNPHDERKSGSITLYDSKGYPINRYKLTNALPKTLETETRKVGNTSVLTEKVVLTYESLEEER
jgi:hypothetical protein